MKNTQQVVDALITMVKDYPAMAAKAVKENENVLYVPGYMTKTDLLRVMRDPSILTQSGSNGTEPSYLSLENGLLGRNNDGTVHTGFIMIDIIAREIVDIVDRNGVSSINNLNTKSWNGVWSGYEVQFTDDDGKKYVATTRRGIRGTIAVTVTIQDGVYTVSTADAQDILVSLSRVMLVVAEY